MREVARVSEIAEGGEPVAALDSGSLSRQGAERKQHERPGGNGSQLRPQAPHQDLGAPGSFSAFALSNHQTWRKPGVRPGKVCGWP